MTSTGTWNLAQSLYQTASRSDAAFVIGSTIRWTGGGLVAACLITAVYVLSVMP